MTRIALLGVVVVTCGWAQNASAQAPDFKFKFVETRRKTVEVTSVDPKGLAWQMGLKTDDTILRIGDARIASAGDLKNALATLRGKYKVEVRRVVGSGKEKRIEQPILKGELRSRGDKGGTYYIVKEPE